MQRCGGQANKNIGDAFLLVWKMKDQDQKDVTDKNVTDENRQLADMALFSFIKVVAKINKFSHILKFNEMPEIQDRLPGYRVSLGLGLHQGWSIEGTIGSYHKIDASYLSANVNMSQRLETATKKYGATILMSQQFHEIMSRMVKTITREIDRILVGDERMKLYTVDISTKSCVKQADEFLHKPLKEKRSHEVEERRKLWDF